MAGQSSTATRILDAAERRVRTAGYGRLSFRDVAADVGIKSASVHHHFPTKEALVTTLAARYTERFFDSVSEAGTARLTAYRTAFRRSLEADGQMCLCGMLGAESAGLPGSVVGEARRFFSRAVAHLAGSLDAAGGDPRGRAMAIIAQLEGALILARTCGDINVFDEATADLEAS